MKDQPAFTIEDACDMVARLIPLARIDASGFATHHSIVATVLADKVGATLVTQARARKPDAWQDDRQAAANMVAWFSKKYTDDPAFWGEFFDRQKQGGNWAYHARTGRPPAVPPAPEFIDAPEGNRRLTVHFRRERNHRLIQKKRDDVRRPDGHLECEVCKLVLPAAYPGLSGDLCEVHHRQPLANAAQPVMTRLEDLAVLCPNCHRAIHRTDPLLSVEEIRSRFFAGEEPRPSQVICLLDGQEGSPDERI